MCSAARKQYRDSHSYSEEKNNKQYVDNIIIMRRIKGKTELTLYKYKNIGPTYLQ